MPNAADHFLRYLVVGFICFLLGVFVEFWQEPRVSRTPYRRGDRVMVKTGFLSGRVGELIEREVSQQDRSVTFDIRFEDGKEGKFTERNVKEQDIILAGDWNQ